MRVPGQTAQKQARGRMVSLPVSHLIVVGDRALE